MNTEPLPRLVVTPVAADRPDVHWLGRLVERSMIAAVEVNKALLAEASRTAGRLAGRARQR